MVPDMNQRFLNPALTLLAVVPLVVGAAPNIGAGDAGGHAKSDPKAIVKLVQKHCVKFTEARRRRRASILPVSNPISTSGRLAANGRRC